MVRDFSLSGAPFTGDAALGMIGTFINLFVSSFLIGLVIGIIGSLFLKKLKQYNIGRVAECALIVLFAYLSYILTEALHLSPIIALLFNGIFNSHYSFYNLSFQAREESSVLSRVLSALAEAFIFAYLGLTAIHYFTVAFSWSFMIFELITVVLGRFVSVLGICFLMESCMKNFKLSWTEKGIASCSGTIRGAIAFGLSISIESKNSLNRDILLSTTLSLVFISTVVFGALMPYVIKFFRSFQVKKEEALIEHNEEEDIPEDDSKNEEIRFSYLHPNFDSNNKMEFSKEKNLKKLKKRLSYWIGTYWISFDDEYVKPKLICGWPEVKKEHDEIAQVIKKVIKDYLKEKHEKKDNLIYENEMNQ
ncbi:MAG: cation:proton antiporter, partial [archaeon]|nr:cation:proton antiporter [archaeon]